jgi:hypothetical protein
MESIVLNVSFDDADEPNYNINFTLFNLLHADP